MHSQRIDDHHLRPADFEDRHTVKPPFCCACDDGAMDWICDLAIYVRGGELPDSVWRCRNCGTYVRASDFRHVAEAGHFDVASYTQSTAENSRFTNRHQFLGNILAWGKRSLNRTGTTTLRVLDIGCAYGHLLDIARAQGAETTGVELVDHLRDLLVERGHTAHRSIDEIASDQRFDVIVAIDSLYYFENPQHILRVARSLLEPEGVLIIRIANRTPFFRLLQLFRRPMTNDHFGDAKYNFSFDGIRRLLDRCGFDLERVILHEKGKRVRGIAVWLYYRVTFVLSVLLRTNLTPGIVIIARPRPAG